MADSSDSTTHAQRMLLLIESALEGRIPLGLETYTIEGQSIGKMPISQLASLRQKYRQERQLEIEAAAAANGTRPRRRIGFKFVPA